MKAIAKIYTLTDENDNVFYVGCTIGSLETRLYDHIQGACNTKTVSNSLKSKKIRELGFKVKIVAVDYMAVEAGNSWDATRKAADLENDWSLKFMMEGIELTNDRIRVRSKLPNAKKIQLQHDTIQFNKKEAAASNS